MEYLKLIGIFIVIIGFAMKLDSLLIILLAAVATGLAGGLGIDGLLAVLGKTFVANRSIAIFVMILFVAGTLERNGLREAAASFIRRYKSATAGRLICIYGVMRSAFAAFNVNFGGVAGFVRPVLMPMAEAAIRDKDNKINEDYLEEIKGMSSAMENIAWFFFQVLFIGGPGALLVQATLSSMGYEVALMDLAMVEIPVALASLAAASAYFLYKDKKLRSKYMRQDDGK